MDLQHIVNSRETGLWALRISQIIPPWIGFRLSNLLADRLAANRSLPVVRAIRLNRWVVSGGKLEGQALDQAVRANLRHVASAYYLLFHNIHSPKALQDAVVFSENLDTLIATSKEGRRGVIVCGLHMNDFDLVVQAAAWRGLQALAISLPQASENTKAVEWQHSFRRETGLQILPASFEAFRTAIRQLRLGKTIITGIDRPISKTKHHPRFFGRPASLPLHHIQLALETAAPIVIFVPVRRKDGRIAIESSEEIRMQRYSSRERELLFNGECVLEAAEEFIRRTPEQWSVFQPVWPEALAELP
jgi:KDO2-lipid IV(A) lauroyltransferase